MRTILVLSIFTSGFLAAQSVPVELDIAPLAPADLDSPYASPRDAARHRFQATMSQLQTDRNVKAALQGLGEAFALDRTYGAAAFNLGVIAAIAEKWEDALGALEEAARLDPSGLGKAAAPEIERLRLIVSLEATPDGKRKRQYDEALYPVARDLAKMRPSDAMAVLAEVGRIDPKRWEAPALLAGVNGNGQGYDVAAKFLEIAVANAADPATKAKLEKALEAAQRELRYAAARSAAETAADRGDYQKAGELYENAWVAMPARVSNGMEAASAWLLHDDTVHAATLLVRLRANGDSEFAQPASAMLKELEVIEPAAKAAGGDAREFFRDAGTPEPIYISDLLPRVDTSAMEVLARPLPKLEQDSEPVVLLAALSANPADAAQANTLPPLAAPRIPGERPWREIAQLAAPAPEASPQPRPVESADISNGARVHRSIRVTSQPARAGVFTGDATQPVCQTPCDIQAAPGSYSLRVSLAGYQDETRQIRIASSGSDIELPLKPVRGSVFVETSAPATVKVNGTAVPNQTPVELSIAPGLYRIATDAHERMVTIKPGARLRLPL